MVRDTRPFFRCWFSRAEIHAAIDRDRVATDNLAVEFLRKIKRKRRLAAAGWAKQQDRQGIRCSVNAIRRARWNHGRHHPGGKIHAGLVRKSHQTRIAAATSNSPKTWLRR